MYQRDSGIANSALVVNVGPQDFGTDPLAGMEFQRYYEKLAFKAGGGCYNAPAQNVASFLKYLQPDLRCNIKATYRPGLTAQTIFFNYKINDMGIITYFTAKDTYFICQAHNHHT